jgi:hypothetical protein
MTDIDRRTLLQNATAAGGMLSVPTIAASADPPTTTPGRDAPGAVFRVGGADRSIAPPPGVEVDVGGYGTCDGCPTNAVRDGDDLEARAMVASDGADAVAVVVIDCQGWMAGYEGEAPGALAGRRRAARALATALDVDAAAADVVIQATHSHAAPANLALWGTDPEYLEFVADQVAAAVGAAADAAEDAVLEVGVGDIGYVNNVTIGQANSFEGWTKDTRLPVVRARAAGTGNDRPGTGRTVATYAQVPAHENIIYGPGVPELSSGHFGAAARWLEAEHGGTAVVGPGTLGDQVTPMQGDTTELSDGTPRAYQVVERLGALSGSTASAAIRSGRIVEDATVASADEHLKVPASNAALFAANCTPAGEAAGFDVDRSCEPPFAYGNVIGTWATTLRLGDVVIASKPGEAHSHVSTAIRNAYPEATVFTAGQAQDQLGYFYAPWAFPATFIYSVNHHYLNVSQTLADQTVQGHVRNSRRLGFEGRPQALDPRAADYSRLFEPGVQVTVFPNRRAVAQDTDGVTVPVGVYTAGARADNVDAGTPVVDFGDGTTETWTDGTYGLHTFPEPGTYAVTARIPEAEPWTVHVTVEDEHHVHAEAAYPDLGTARRAGPSTAAAESVERRGETLTEALAGRPIAEDGTALAPAGMPSATEIGGADL